MTRLMLMKLCLLEERWANLNASARFAREEAYLSFAFSFGDAKGK
jgi:hypothetical protein